MRKCLFTKKNTFALASLAASASLAIALWSWTGKRASFLKTEKNENCQINFWKDRNNLGIICCLRWPGPPLISHGLPSSPRMKGHFQSNPITSASLLLLHFIHFSQLGDLECLGIIIIRRRIKNRPRKEENSLLMNKWNTTKLLVLFSWWKPIRVKLSHPLSPLKKY